VPDGPSRPDPSDLAAELRRRVDAARRRGREAADRTRPHVERARARTGEAWTRLQRSGRDAWRRAHPYVERVRPQAERIARRTVAAIAAGWAWLEPRVRDGLTRADRAWAEHGRPRARRVARRVGSTEVFSDPVRRAAIGIPVVVLVLALVVGLVSVPGIASARALVDAVDRDVLTVPDLPEIDTPAQRSLLFAADGSSLGLLVGEENRVLVGLDRVPEVMRNAVIAAEDRSFYEHDGVNLGAVGRALVRNAAAGGVEQGGSTITQQYVKNALLSPEQTLTRKAQEALYALQIEREMSKDEILERYLNIAYFGNGAYGVAAAAERYFGIAIEDVDAPRAALLAGLIRAPERNDPLDDPEAATRLQHSVLDDMVETGAITTEEADAAKAIPLDELLQPTPPPPPRFPFATEYVKKLLLDEPALGETREDRIEALFSGGLRIHTTLNPEMQDAARRSIVDRLQEPGVDPMAGIVSIEPQTGHVRALAVGPQEFGECDLEANGDEPCTTTKVNPLVPGMGGSGRQVGSTFKPILDTAALANGLGTDWHASTDSGEEVDGCVDYVDGRKTTWTPENYSETGGGVMDMADGIRLSNNVFHAKLIAELGPEKAVEVAHAMGIDADIPAVCAIALGAAQVFPMDMAEAFGVLANDGVRCDPIVVTRVEDAEGNVLLEREPSCEQVIDEEVAHQMVTMMREVVRRGTATRAQVAGWDLAGKTGTTNDFKDAWFVGFARPLVTATWVGYEIPESMYGILGYRRVAGGTVPAEIWRTYMEQALANYEPEALPTVDIDRYVPPPPPKPEPEPEDEEKPEPPGRKKKKDDD
jgi:penicillin-binding protein 1A